MERIVRVGVVLAVLVVLAGGPRAEGIDVTFTSSGEIVDGQEWGNVYIYGDDTVVDMSGGSMGSVRRRGALILISGSSLRRYRTYILSGPVR